VPEVGTSTGIPQTVKYGLWFSVPDNSLEGYPIPFEAEHRYVWIMPDGTQLTMDAGEGLVTYTSRKHWFMFPPWKFLGVRIKCARKTLPGLVAYGLITQADMDRLLSNPATIPEEPKPKALSSVLTGVLILAAVIATATAISNVAKAVR